jgi:glycosyltransferase involved in cell wall biosynthesis
VKDVAPAATVVIVSYQGRPRIDMPLRALAQQDCVESFEVIVVASGTDGCAEQVERHFPSVKILRSNDRLRPGPARNRGVEAANGDVIAFLPDDGYPHRSWLSARLRLHRAGADAVGGAIVAVGPTGYVPRAAHLLEYSSLLPYDELLAAQEVPHCLSFRRSVFVSLGRYPEDTTTGEDTIFNLRCREANLSYAFSSDIRMGHCGLPSLRKNVRHAFLHGRGLMQCSRRHGLGSTIGVPHGTMPAAWRCLVRYPAVGLASKVRRLARYAPQELLTLALTSPVIALLLVATGVGAFVEWRQERIS